MPDPLYSYPDITTSGKKIYMNVTTFNELKKVVLGTGANRADANQIMEQVINGTATSGRYNNMWNLLRNGFEYSDVQLSSSSSGSSPTQTTRVSSSFPVIDRLTNLPKITMPETKLDKSLTVRTERVFLLIGCSMDLTIKNFGLVSVSGNTSTITPDTCKVTFTDVTGQTPSQNNLKLSIGISGENIWENSNPGFNYYTTGKSGVYDGIYGINSTINTINTSQPIFKSILYGQYSNAYGTSISYGADQDSSIGSSERTAGRITRRPTCILIYEVGTLNNMRANSVVNPGKILINSLDVTKAVSNISLQLTVELAQKTGTGSSTSRFSVADRFDLTPTTGVLKTGSGYGDATPCRGSFGLDGTKSIDFGKLPFSHSIMLQVLGVNSQPQYSTYYLGCKETPDNDRYPDGMRKKSVHHYFWCTKNPSTTNTNNNPASLHIRFSVGQSMFQGDTFYAPENCQLKYMDSSGNLQLFNPRAAELKPRISETPAGYYDKYFTLPVVLERLQSIDARIYGERSTYRPLFVTSMMGSMKTFKSLTSDHFDMENGNTIANAPTDPRGMDVGGWTINNFGKIKESVASGAAGSSYWMFGRDKDDAGIYRETVEYGPLYFEPITAANDEERRTETYKYVFYFHFFYFDYSEYMNDLIDEDDDLETTAVLGTADYPFFDNDKSNYADEGTEDTERTDLTLNQADLIWMKLLVGEDGKVIFPEDEDRKLYYGIMTPDDNEYLPEIERDRIQMYSIAHERMKPLSVKYPDITEALNKNKVFPFEILWEPDQDDLDIGWQTAFNNKMNSTNRAVYPTFTDRLDNENVTGTIGSYVDDGLTSNDTRISRISYVAKLDNN